MELRIAAASSSCLARVGEPTRDSSVERGAMLLNLLEHLEDSRRFEHSDIILTYGLRHLHDFYWFPDTSLSTHIWRWIGQLKWDRPWLWYDLLLGNVRFIAPLAYRINKIANFAQQIGTQKTTCTRSTKSLKLADYNCWRIDHWRHRGWGCIIMQTIVHWNKF